MSGMRVAFPATRRTWFFDAFPRYVCSDSANFIFRFSNKVDFLFFNYSIDKIPKIKSPVLVIHGTSDEVIDFSHGVSIYEKCPKAVEPLWIKGK